MESKVKVRMFVNTPYPVGCGWCVLRRAAGNERERAGWSRPVLLMKR
jgi:hypothetical protein